MTSYLTRDLIVINVTPSEREPFLIRAGVPRGIIDGIRVHTGTVPDIIEVADRFFVPL